MNGILNIHKPPGISSFGVVAKIRSICGERRVGHGGTLDLEATGVLPVFIGKATRAVDYLLEWRKVYRAVIMLGIATDTYDAAGKVTGMADASQIKREDALRFLSSFSGEIMQTPPMFSALKHNGRSLYHLARAGVSFECRSRPVTVYRIELLGFASPSLEIEVECSRGTYIRSLAHDLGKLLGCGAHLVSLVRTRYGPFDLADALPLSGIDISFKEDAWQDRLRPIDTVLRHLPEMIFCDEDAKIIKNGGGIAVIESPVPDNINRRYRAYNKNGEFFAVIRFNPEAELWKAEKVFM